LALAQLPTSFFPAGTWPDQPQQGTVTCLRSVLMKPEHLSWLQEIWSRLSQVTAEVLVEPVASAMAPESPLFTS
jgi:hypothetical protein